MKQAHFKSKDFSKQVNKTLAAKGIYIVGAQWLPNTDGDYTNGQTGYKLNDNGCGKIVTYSEVIALAN